MSRVPYQKNALPKTDQQCHAMLSIAHAINPVDARPPSDLVVVQPLTFQSKRLAKQNREVPRKARSTASVLDVPGNVAKPCNIV